MLDAHVRAALRRLEAEDERDALEGRTERSLAVLPTTGALLYCLALAQTQRGTARDRRFTRLLDDLDRGRGARELGSPSFTRSPREQACELRREHRRSWPRRLRRGAGRECVRDAVAATGAVRVRLLGRLEGRLRGAFRACAPQALAGALVVADNVISHASVLAAYCAARQADPGLLSLTLPLDSGLELTTVLTGSLHSG